MNVSFLLPGSSRFPVGGYKIVFEYANHLTERGHAVSIVLPAMIDPSVGFGERLYHLGRYILWGVTGRFGPKTWFSLRPEVKLSWVVTLREKNIPDADMVIATGWPTAEYAALYGPAKGRKYYFIQHYETWYGPEDRVRSTWQLPLQKIVIARWLERIATELGQTSVYIPNGLDFKAFGCDRPIRERRGQRVAMLYHEFGWKGSADGIRALEIVKDKIPSLSATMFGVYPKPADLPAWVEYVENAKQADLRKIYNSAQVFISPSWAEGWPLPPAEAMMCGAGLVATDIDGHREYAVHEQNALLAPPNNPEALASALIRMLTDHELRYRLAEQALRDIGRFTWKTAVDKFEATLSTAPTG